MFAQATRAKADHRWNYTTS